MLQHRPFDSAEWYDRYGYDKGWTKAECDFIESVSRKHSKTTRRESPRMLDVACGTGRHALEFSSRGYGVVGIDLSQEMIDMARRKSQGRPGVTFHRMDMRAISFRQQFDLAYLWFNTFPLLVTNQDAISTLEGINKALVKGGVFVFQYGNAWPWERVDSFRKPAEFGHRDGKIRFLTTSRISQCPQGNVLHRTLTTRIWEDEVELEGFVYDFKQRTYSVDEIDLLARLTGFSLAKVYGSSSTESEFPEKNEEIIPVLVKLGQVPHRRDAHQVYSGYAP